MKILARILKELLRFVIYVFGAGYLGFMISMGVLSLYSHPKAGGDSVFGLAGGLLIFGIAILFAVIGFIFFVGHLIKRYG